MVIHAVISYPKVKKIYGVRTLKEAREVIASRFEEKLEEIALEGSFWYSLWNREGTRRIGESYSIKANDKKDLEVVRELLRDVADKVELL